MTVYVDDSAVASGGVTMSHMIADTEDELRAMADRVGVKRERFQDRPPSDAHYEIALAQRKLAVALGAVEITLRECALMCRHRRATGVLGTPERP
jgi:hypothetical protein